MKVIIGETEYKVYWKHNNHTQEVDGKLDKRFGVKKPESSTLCWTVCGDGKEVAQGYAVLHKNDKNFIKAKGRVSSLRNALKQTNFSKDERMIIWDEYFNYIEPKVKKHFLIILLFMNLIINQKIYQHI